MKYAIVFAYGTTAQRWWSGRRWVGDPSDAEEYETDRVARSAFRQLVARANLKHGEAVVVEAYGLVTEAVAYCIDETGMVVAGDWNDHTQH